MSDSTRGPLPAATLADWIAHTVNGESLSDIGRRRNNNKSTVWRRNVRVEGLTDCLAWSAILDRITAAAPAHPSLARNAPPEAVLRLVLGINPDTAAAAFIAASGALTSPDALVGLSPRLDVALVAGLPDAAPLLRVPRDMALAWLVMGWLVSLQSRGGAARLRLCPGGERRIAVAALSVSGRRVDTLVARCALPPDRAAFARSLVYDLATAPDHARARLRAALPEDHADIVAAYLGTRANVEDIERRAGIPARSCKAIVAGALAVLQGVPA